MDAILECCCGIDLHKDSIVACILSGATDEVPSVIMREFGTQYDAITELAQWLSGHGCKDIAMESTGSYWMPLYNRLSELGANCTVVNAQRVKNVPGRKTDWNDARWIGYLFRHGLLAASYVPEREQQILRSHTRALESLTQDRTREKNRIEKLLQAEGFKLSSVLEDIFGLTGRKLLQVLYTKGCVSLSDVQKHRSIRCKCTAQEIASAMKGTLPAPLRKLLQFNMRQIEEYDRQIKELECLIHEIIAPFLQAVNLIGSIPGIAQQSAIQIIAEIGSDMDTFQSAEKIAAWAGLSPRNAQSAGKKSPHASCQAISTSSASSTNVPGAVPVPKTPLTYEVGSGLSSGAPASKRLSSLSPESSSFPSGPCSSPVSFITLTTAVRNSLNPATFSLFLSLLCATAFFSTLVPRLFS